MAGAHFSFEEIIGIYTGEEGDSLINFLKNYMYELKSEQPEFEATHSNSNVEGWNRGAEQDLFENKELQDFVGNNFREYLKCYAIKQPPAFEFTSLFCNILPPGTCTVMHAHAYGEFTGTLWIQAEQDAGQLVIMSPLHNQFANTSLIPERDYNAMYIDPEPNKGVFFNSNLVHYIDINRSKKDRVSLGYNIKVNCRG